jgi:hypothetical protein
MTDTSNKALLALADLIEQRSERAEEGARPDLFNEVAFIMIRAEEGRICAAALRAIVVERQAGVQIKPLVWRGDYSWTWKAAQTSIGEYLVQECDCGGTSLKLEGHFEIWHSETRDEYAAKAAAQADYEARIRAALKGPNDE